VLGGDLDVDPAFDGSVRRAGDLDLGVRPEDRSLVVEGQVEPLGDLLAQGVGRDLAASRSHGFRAPHDLAAHLGVQADPPKVESTLGQRLAGLGDGAVQGEIVL